MKLSPTKPFCQQVKDLCEHEDAKISYTVERLKVEILNVASHPLAFNGEFWYTWMVDVPRKWLHRIVEQMIDLGLTCKVHFSREYFDRTHPSPHLLPVPKKAGRWNVDCYVKKVLDYHSDVIQVTPEIWQELIGEVMLAYKEWPDCIVDPDTYWNHVTSIQFSVHPEQFEDSWELGPLVCGMDLTCPTCTVPLYRHEGVTPDGWHHCECQRCGNEEYEGPQGFQCPCIKPDAYDQ